MRSLLLALLVSGSLTACSKDYWLDLTVPAKTVMITPEVGRFGVDPAKSQCLAGTLGAKLSVWELRQVQEAWAAQRASRQGAVGEHDLWRIVPQIRVPRVRQRVAGALADCAVSQVAVAMSNPRVAAAPTVDGQTQAAAAAGKIPNGPADYTPSDQLLSALDAFERADYMAAARLARMAADSGDSGAQQFLGGLYAAGQGVKADPAAAARYYKLAAERGWSEAMNNLGKAYETGTGVRQDPVEALKWYLLASARATEDEQMVARNMQALMSGLVPAAVEQARTLARDWEQAHRR